MTRISRRPLRKNLEDRMFQVFWQTFADLKNEKDVLEFLEDLLSPAEKVMLAKRLAIAILLEKGWNYDDISDSLKVSTTTVNSIKQKMSFLGKGYKRVIRNILNREEVANFFEKLTESVTSTLYPVKGIGIKSAVGDLAGNYHRSQKSKRDIL